MANKPIWIIRPASVKDGILRRLAGGCPRDIEGLEQYGDVSCGEHGGCKGHWLEFIDFDCGEEEGDDEE